MASRCNLRFYKPFKALYVHDTSLIRGHSFYNPQKQFEVSVHLEALNTFRVQAATRKWTEGIVLDTARGDAKRLEALMWDVSVEALKKRAKKGQETKPPGPPQRAKGQRVIKES